MRKAHRNCFITAVLLSVLAVVGACTQKAGIIRAYERGGEAPPTFPSRAERRQIHALVRGFWEALGARDSVTILAMSTSSQPLEYFNDFFSAGSWIEVRYDDLDVMEPFTPPGPNLNVVVYVTLPRRACPPQYGTNRRKTFVFELVEASDVFRIVRVGSDIC